MKVSNKIHSGRVPVTIKCATRCANVFVFPVPAPAMTSSGPKNPVAPAPERPYSTAARWATFRSCKYVGQSMSSVTLKSACSSFVLIDLGVTIVQLNYRATQIIYDAPPASRTWLPQNLCNVQYTAIDSSCRVARISLIASRTSRSSATDIWPAR